MTELEREYIKYTMLKSIEHCNEMTKDNFLELSEDIKKMLVTVLNTLGL